MADVPKSLIDGIAKVVIDRASAPAAKESTVYGTVAEHAGSLYVKLDGSDQLTPIDTMTEAVAGERVAVLIKDHRATVTGNLSSPSARSATVKEMDGRVAEIETDNIRVNETLEASRAEIGELRAENAAISGKLTAAEAEVDRLKVDKLDAAVADITYATIGDLDAANADIRNLEADYAEVESLVAGKLDADSADIRYANVDFANIGEAALHKIFADSGIIKDIVVEGGTVTGELVGVTIRGDLIEGNTIVADKLVVKGTDGLYYKLNTDGMGVEAQQTDYNSLNGSVIRAKSITATKINVSDLVAFGATIGGFKIDSHSIYSGVKSSSSNTTRGVFLGDDGQLAVGDANNFVKYYRDADGSYKLAIQADSIEFKSSSLKFGGRNLLRFTSELPVTGDPKTGLCGRWCHTLVGLTGTADGARLDFSGNSNDCIEVPLAYDGCVGSGEEVTLSFSYRGTLTTPGRFYFIQASTPNVSLTMGGALVGDGEWHRYSWTFSHPEANARTCVTALLFYDNAAATGKWVEIHKGSLKLERGNQTTDWTPAPEDVDASIAAKSSVRQVERNRSDTMAQLRAYAAEGSRNNWTTWKSYSGISPGDTVQLKCDCSDTGKPVYILMTVESVTASSATCVSHGMIDPNAELAAKAYTDAQIKVADDKITAEVSERSKLGTKVSTLEQTASGLQSQVTSARSLANLALGNRDNFCQLTAESCARFGWTYDGSDATRWYSKAAERDQYASEWFSVKPGDKIRVTGQASSTARGPQTNGGTDVAYAAVNIGLMVMTDRGTPSWPYARAAMSDASGTVGSIDWTYTIPDSVHRARVFIQCFGWPPWSGTVKVRDLCVSSAAALAADVSANASQITQLSNRITTEVSSLSSFRSFTTGYSYAQAQVDQFGTPGYQGTWAVNESTAGLKAGDTVQLRMSNTTKSGHAFVIATVVSVPSDKSVVARTTGLVDTGDRGATGATGAQGPKGTSGTDLSQGRALYADPFFSSGTNGCSVYNNSGNGTVAVTRQARSADNPCTQSGYELKITTSGAASPGHGGVYQNIQSRANAVFVRRVIAKIPVGYSINCNQNSMGTGLTDEWLTDRAGTGAFREYMYRYRCGPSGSFSTGGHMLITGGSTATAAAPVVWYLAMCQTYDMTGAPDASEALAAASALQHTVTELSTRVDQTNTAITDSISRKTTEIRALQTALSGVEGQVGTVSGRVEEMTASFRRTMDASGNPVLDLMTTANGFSTRITNSEMAFLDNGQKVAYVSNKKLYIDQAEVVGQMKIGDYAWVQRSGHLSLKYVGA